MEERSDDNAAVDMASRIEKTLADREQARMKELPVAIEVTDSERARGGTPYFNYLMLLLGVVAGAVLGAALYFMLLVPTSSPTANLQPVEVTKELAAADRLLSAGQYGPARKAYLALISQGSSSPRPYNNLASLYAAEGDLEQARVLLKKALATDPDYLTVYHNVGMVYAAMARDSYGKALQLKGETKSLRLQALGPALSIPLEAQKAETPQVVKPSGVEPVVMTAKTEIEKPVQATIIRAKDISPLVGSQAEAPPVVEKGAQKTAIPDMGAMDQVVSVVAAEPGVPLDSANSDPSVSVAPQQFLKQWAMAWSSQDVDTYLQSYAAEYVPGGNLTNEAWQEKRRKRLTAPSFIEVELDSIELMSQTGDTSTVQAIQLYRSDRYQDRTRKSFVLRRNAQAWVIVEERSLGRVR